MVLPSGGATLDLKTSNLKLNSNLSIFPSKPWKLDMGVKTHSIFYFIFLKIWFQFS
jgi:hypothetical protein